MTETLPPPSEDLARASFILEKMYRDMYSLDPERPGVMLRQDRIERQIASGIRFLQWIGGGGLAGLGGTLYFLYQISQNFAPS